jgi:hypothetical protein
MLPRSPKHTHHQHKHGRVGLEATAVPADFAETTEAYFDRHDMEPFDRAELKTKDPKVVPVLEQLWGLR